MTVFVCDYIIALLAVIFKWKMVPSDLLSLPTLFELSLSTSLSLSLYIYISLSLIFNDVGCPLDTV